MARRTYLLASIPSAVLVGKVGSDVNYLLEFSAALGLATRGLYRVAAQAAAVADRPYSPSRDSGTGARPIVSGRFGFAGLRYRAAGRGRAAIPYGGERGRARAHGRLHGTPATAGAKHLLPAFRMTQLTRDGDWDRRPILKDIERQNFPMIMI